MNVLGSLLVIVLLISTMFGARECNLRMNKHYAPQERALENEVFKQSEQYNESMIRDLENFRYDYSKATPMQQEIIKATVHHRFSTYNSDKLSLELRQFLSLCKE
jgi:hypothetical protein